MCTAATYRTKDFYMGRTLDYEFSYGEQITVTPRHFPLALRHGGTLTEHYAIIGMAHVADGYPLYYDAVNEKGLGMPVMRTQKLVRRTLRSLSSFRGCSDAVQHCQKHAKRSQRSI